MVRKENKCDKCKLKETLKKAIEDARKSQEHYMTQVEKVNKTLAKYNKKLDEIK